MMNKKKGSALALTLIVLAVLMIFVSTLFVVGLSNNKIINANDNSNKLNLMAESGIDAALAQVKKATSASSLSNITGVKSTDGNINCDVTFYKGQTYNPSTKSYTAASGKDTIESKASNSKGTKIIRVVINEAVVAPKGVIPTNNLIYVNGAVTNGNFNCGTANGDIYINGNFYMSSGSSIKGKLVATGNITLTGGTSSNNGIISFGNVELDSGAAINGDTIAKGDLTFGGGASILGNVQADGNLNMPQGNIQNNATIGKNATFSGGSKKIGGKLYYLGTATTGWGTITDFVPAGAVKTSNYTPVDLSSYSAPATLPNISTPNIINNVTVTNNTINSSGKLTSSTFNGYSYGSTITIDTSSSDINLLINNFNFDPENGLDFVVSGTHNLYIYITGSNGGFSLGSNQFFGMKNKTLPSQIFIFGDSNQSVKLNNCELDANIYIPNGSFSASGGNNPYMFQGSCTTKSVNIDSQINVNYSKPNIIGTPLEILNSGDAGQGSTTSFSVDKWYY